MYMYECVENTCALLCTVICAEGSCSYFFGKILYEKKC